MGKCCYYRYRDSPDTTCQATNPSVNGVTARILLYFSSAPAFSALDYHDDGLRCLHPPASVAGVAAMNVRQRSRLYYKCSTAFRTVRSVILRTKLKVHDMIGDVGQCFTEI